jgi:chromosome segregation ATPase
LGLVLTVATPAQAAPPQQTNQETNREKLQRVLKSLSEAVSGMDRLIATIGTTHQTLHDDMGDKMPQDLARDLTRELDILLHLHDSQPLLSELLQEEQSLLDGQGLYSPAHIQANISGMMNALLQLQATLRDKSAQRREYRKRLQTAIDALITANPQKTETYKAVKACLDPDALDQLIANQIAVLQGTRDWLAAFQQR